MLIKHKLIANTAILVIAMSLMLILLNYESLSLQNNITIAKKIGDIKASILELRREEQDFSVRKDLQYVDKFTDKMRVAKEQISILADDFSRAGLSVPELNSMKAILVQYQSQFNKIVLLQRRIGLTPKAGLYGQLRAAVHDVETLIGKDNFQLLSEMLQLRRNEKDFMLRLDDKYVDKLKENTDILSLSVQASNLSPYKKQEIIKLIKAYQGAFLNLMSGQKELGYHQNMGVMKGMRDIVGKVDNQLIKLIVKSEAAVK